MKGIMPLVLALAVLLGGCATGAREESGSVIGKKAPSWFGVEWLDAANPLALSDLKGRVIVMHWWTDGCPPCVDNLSFMSKLQQRYGPQGAVVVTVYFPNPRKEVALDGLRAAAQILSLNLPTAVDGDWSLRKRYHISEAELGSLIGTVIIDAEGRIRAVQGGDLISPAAAERIDGAVRDLIAESRGGPKKV